MAFFDITITLRFDESFESIFEDSDFFDEDLELPFGGSEKPKVRVGKAALGEINELLGYECGFDGRLSAGVYAGNNEQLQLFASLKMDKVSMSECQKYLIEQIMEVTGAKAAEFKSVKEIRAKDLGHLEKRAESAGIDKWCGRMSYQLGTDFYDNCNFKASEYCYTDSQSNALAVKKANGIMADDSFLEEIGRIYRGSKIKKFYGHPVHYKINAAKDSAQSIVDILIPALQYNHRLICQRVTWITNISEQCFNEDDIKNIFKNSDGGAVIIDTSADGCDMGNYASAYERVVDYFSNLIDSHKLNTLFIFIDNPEKNGFSKKLTAKIQDSVNLIQISDGRGDNRKAAGYFCALSKESDYPATKEEANELFSEKKTYTASEVCAIYRDWFGNSLLSKVYTEYKSCQMVKIEDEKKESDPYKILQDMVGLTDIKSLVDDIIDTGRAKKLREKAGLNTFKQSMHMIFTGNPGSAKTTVARLIAQILKAEGILESGNYVECGRQDLVGQYVGWTAPTVARKFREAKGGILFIDEAYSLVEEGGYYGDEAINTIVQEMENHREDVIVIFAGYPDKMEKFLEKNEGLRSRIAFHLNFPDYKAGEMLDILKLMARDRKLTLSDGCEEKCFEIFEKACQNQEFGNGRFARNLIEQAVMRQSKRVISENRGRKISKAKLSELKPEDFNTLASEQYKKADRVSFGFSA